MHFTCSLEGCESTSEDISVFNFPRNREMLQKWLKRIEIKGNEINQDSRICIKHFKNEDIDDHNRLKSDAIPEMVIVDFSLLIREINETILPKFDGLKLLTDPENCICLYSIKFTNDYSDVIIPFKVFINIALEIKVEQYQEKDIWTTENSTYSSIQDLEKIISSHFNNIEAVEEEQYMDVESIIEEEEEVIEEPVEILDHAFMAINTKKDLKCQNCLITFKTALGLEQHQKTCQTPKVIIERVKKVPLFKSKSIKTKTNCPYCNILLLTHSLGRHIRAIHLKQKHYSCSICCKNFATASLKSAHEKTHERNLELQQYLCSDGERSYYHCPHCNEAKFERSDLLKNHMEKNCYNPPKKRAYNYGCQFCPDIKFNTKILAAKHAQEVHNLKIENLKKFCFECNEEFEDYPNHIRMHTCSYVCRFCSMKFLTEAKCTSHEIAKHQNEDDRPFICEDEDCFATFKSQQHLKSHMDSIHRSKEIERKFTCEFCGDKFTCRALLTVHLRTHDSNPIFACKFCDKRFKKLSNLKIHSITIHQTDAIYVCSISDCSGRFKLLNELKVHSLKEHGKNLNIQKYFHEVV